MISKHRGGIPYHPESITPWKNLCALQYPPLPHCSYWDPPIKNPDIINQLVHRLPTHSHHSCHISSNSPPLSLDDSTPLSTAGEYLIWDICLRKNFLTASVFLSGISHQIWKLLSTIPWTAVALNRSLTSMPQNILIKRYPTSPKLGAESML